MEGLEVVTSREREPRTAGTQATALYFQHHDGLSLEFQGVLELGCQIRQISHIEITGVESWPCSGPVLDEPISVFYIDTG